MKINEIQSTSRFFLIKISISFYSRDIYIKEKKKERRKLKIRTKRYNIIKVAKINDHHKNFSFTVKNGLNFV
jgi:hypothetical protein